MGQAVPGHLAQQVETRVQVGDGQPVHNAEIIAQLRDLVVGKVQPVEAGRHVGIVKLRQHVI